MCVMEQLWISFFEHQSLIFFFPKQGVSLTWNSTSRLDWLASKPQRFVYLCLPNTGTAKSWYHTQIFYADSRNGIQVLMFGMWHVFTCLLVGLF